MTTLSNRYRVVVIDDHPLFRKGAAQLLEMDANFELVGEATNGEDGILMIKDLKPDLVLLDLNMKGMNGIEVLDALKSSDDLNSLVIVLSVSDHQQDIVKALRKGADGYLLKDMEPEDLLTKLHQAIQGDVVLDETVSKLLGNAMRGNVVVAEQEQVSLTKRESEILGLIASGLPNKLISQELDISEGTVKVHVKNLLRKLRLRSRLEAAVWAIERGYGKS